MAIDAGKMCTFKHIIVVDNGISRYSSISISTKHEFNIALFALNTLSPCSDVCCMIMDHEIAVLYRITYNSTRLCTNCMLACYFEVKQHMACMPSFLHNLSPFRLFRFHSIVFLHVTMSSLLNAMHILLLL